MDGIVSWRLRDIEAPYSPYKPAPSPPPPMLPTSLPHTLCLFNAQSRDPADHFKLAPPAELRLCSEHPRCVTCTVGDDLVVCVRGDGPQRFGARFALDRDPMAALQSLLELLQERRTESDELFDWECEDWVGAGYPCRMWDRRWGGGGLDFAPDDLWCVGLMPGVDAGLR